MRPPFELEISHKLVITVGSIGSYLVYQFGMTDILSPAWAAFLEVASTKSLTKAAINLKTHQPVISRRLKALEEELGLKLVERTNRGIRLTKIGQSVFDSLWSQSQLLQNSVREHFMEPDEPKGIYRVGCHRNIGVAYLPRWVPDLLQKHEQLQLEFIFAESRRVAQMVLHGDLDYGLVVDPPNSPDLIVRLIAREAVGIYARSRTEKSPLKIIYYNPEFALLKRVRARVRRSRAFAVADYDVAASLAASTTDAAAILPATVAERWGLVLREEIPRSSGEINLIYRSSMKGSRATQVILQALKSRSSAPDSN